MAEPLILTNVGLAKLASATPEDQLHIADVAVGDGNGGYPPLDPSMTALVHEVWRGTASSPIRDPDNDAVLIFETIIPANEGGFFIREIGLFDADGDMIAIGQTGIVEKPNGGSGTPMTMTVRVRLALANASQTNLIINDAPYIDHQALSNRSANNAHPMSAITGLSSALNGKLAKSQNLADLADVATARYNLELGTAALRDATTSNTDATLGRVVRVGDFGIGRKIPLAWPTGDMDAAPTNVPNGFYVCEYATTNKPTDYGGMIIWQWHGINTGTLTYTTYDIRPRVFVRRWYGTEWAGWCEVTNTPIYDTETDLNNYFDPGAYILPGTGLTNLPSGWSQSSYYMFIEGNPDSALRMQMLVGVLHGGIAVRNYNQSTHQWNTWQSRTYAKATTAQAQALTDDETVITPLKLAQAFPVLAKGISPLRGMQVYSAAGMYNWAVPANVEKALVTVVGAGGGGGGTAQTASASAAQSGGGGGGGAAIKLVDLTGITLVAVTVGAGGAGGTNGSTAGATGGTSSFGAFCSATGGQGGSAATASTSSVNTDGGSGGTGTGGDVNFPGMRGAGGRVVSGLAYGSNFGGGSLMAPVNMQSSFAAGSANAVDGSFPGQGGTGVTGSVSGTSTGGTGADGIVIIQW